MAYHDDLLAHALALLHVQPQSQLTSNRILDSREFPYTNDNAQVVKDLRELAQGFSQLQEDRHNADYNLTKPLDPVDALRQAKAAEKIFLTLPAIKTEQIVQEYLTVLLVKKR